MGHLTEKHRLIPEYLIKCIDSKGFINEVIARTSSTCSLHEAYQSLETDYEQHFGQKKFSDFTSFRVIMYRHRKKIKQ